MKFKFEQYNPNPKGYKGIDCVVRAVTKALNQDWYTAYDGLCAIGRKKCRMPNDDLVYTQYLKEHGFNQHKTEYKGDTRKRYTVKGFFSRDDIQEGTYVLRISGHLTVVVVEHGVSTMYDLSDCSAWAMGVYMTNF